MDRHAVITGMGAIAPNGIGLHDFASALRAGRSGISNAAPAERGLDGQNPLHGRPRATVATRALGACRQWDPASALPAAETARLPRLVPMAIAAAQQAITQSNIDISTDDHAQRLSVILGTGAGGIDFTLTQSKNTYHSPPGNHQKPDNRPTPSIWTITNATHGNLAGELSIALGARGPSLCISDGCASASDALGHALMLLRSDAPHAPDAVLVAGADAHLRWETILGMELLGVLSSNTDREPAHLSRPFDRDRDGFILAEGAWAVLLERPDHAARRDATPIATIDGFAMTCDAYHRVRPNPAMTESARAIRLAIEDAGLTPADIELVHYHGTATELNDRLETAAVKTAFAHHASRLRGHSVKSMIGHPQGASGLASLVATLAGLTNADRHESGPFVFPTINLDTPDPDCDLNYTPNHNTTARGDEVFLVNCLAFGAKNSALVGRALPSH